MNLAEKIDIVIVNSNNGQKLIDCITHVRENTSGEYNLIVVDQNSTDGTREWLIANVPHVILDNTRGTRADGRNKGIKATKCNWILFLDADILIKDKDWLIKMWNYTIDAKIGFIEGRVKVGDKVKFGSTSFGIIRRQCLNEIGYFDTRLKKGSELEWLTRLEWSKWITGYCYNVDTMSLTGKGMAGCFVEDFYNFQQDVMVMLGFKYTNNFIRDSLLKNIKRRNLKVKQLLERGYGNSNSRNAEPVSNSESAGNDSNSGNVASKPDS